MRPTGVTRGMHACGMRAAGRSRRVVYHPSAGPDGRPCRSMPLGAEVRTADPVHSRDCGPAMVGGGVSRPVHAGRMVMVKLFRSRLHMVLPGERLFLRRRLTVYTARAVKTRAVIDDRSIIDNRTIYIRVVYDRGVYIDNGGIIPEVSPGPFAADKTRTSITKAIVHASVEPYVRAPVAAMPSINAARVSPVTRGPQVAWRGRQHPYTGHPIVPIIPIGPITGCPHIIIGRTSRLHIYRNGRRRRTYRNADGYAELCRGGRRKKGQRQAKRSV